MADPDDVVTSDCEVVYRLELIERSGIRNLDIKKPG
jgi:hypothetical protein